MEGKIAHYLAHGQFESAGTAIENEINKINERLDALSNLHPQTLKPIITDKDGKPEGGKDC